MKRLLTCLTALLITVGRGEAQTMDRWTTLSADSLSAVELDTSRVAVLSPTRRSAWLRTTKIEGGSKTLEDIELYEIDCLGYRTRRTERFLRNARTGKTMDLGRYMTFPEPWTAIVPETVGEAIADTVCRRSVR